MWTGHLSLLMSSSNPFKGLWFSCDTRLTSTDTYQYGPRDRTERWYLWFGYSFMEHCQSQAHSSVLGQSMYDSGSCCVGVPCYGLRYLQVWHLCLLSFNVLITRVALPSWLLIYQDLSSRSSRDSIQCLPLWSKTYPHHSKLTKSQKNDTRARPSG